MINHDELCNSMRAKIDLAGLAAAHMQYPGTTWGKFFDTNAYIHAAAHHALRLNAELKPRANCIDIGAGFGYVALALECLGHQCTAWDGPAEVLQAIAPCIPVSHRIFKMIKRKMGVREMPFDRPDVQPIIRGAYDLITLHGVWPMRDAEGWWDVTDYAWLGGIFIRALAPGGRLEILANRGDQLETCTNIGPWNVLINPEISYGVGDNVIDVRRATAIV